MKKLRQYKLLTAMLATMLFACREPSGNLPNHAGYMAGIMDKYFEVEIGKDRYFKLVDSAYHTIHNPGPGDLWDNYLYKYFFFYYKKVDYNLAYPYTDSMLYALRKEKDLPEYLEMYAKSFFYKGDLLAAQKHYLESFDWYYQARKLVMQKNDPCSFVDYSLRLAAVSFQQEKYLQAADYYKLSIKDITSCNKFSPLVIFKGIQGNLDNIGICYVRIGKIDSAELYFTKALAFIKENEALYKDQGDFMNMARAVIYGNYADVAINRKKTAMAEYLLKECIRINDTPSHAPVDAAISRAKLTKLYLDNGKIKDAEAVLKKITPEQYTGFIDLTKKYYLLHSRLAEANGNLKSAYHYLLLYHQYIDSIALQAGPVATADMQQTIDNISRQYQMEILEKNNKLKSNFLWLATVITIMAIVIIFLVLTNYRRSKKNVTTLLNLNETIAHKNTVLLQTLGALEQSHNNNSRLLKVVAHDLRGPLGAISSISELANDGLVPDEKYPEVMKIIFKSGTKALSLTNELLTDMQSLGKLTNLEPLNVADQLNYCMELYTHRMKEKNQTAILNIIPAFVEGDREKLWRVFSNLISNAVKFSLKGGIITITTTLENNKLIISFHDEGIGIPESLKDRIFEPIEATTRPGTFGEPSFGLGLSIARHIISLHKGSLWYESSAETGTTFYVSLPVVGK